MFNTANFVAIYCSIVRPAIIKIIVKHVKVMLLILILQSDVANTAIRHCQIAKLALPSIIVWLVKIKLIL